jgi:hypothetical protein
LLGNRESEAAGATDDQAANHEANLGRFEARGHQVSTQRSYMFERLW